MNYLTVCDNEGLRFTCFPVCVLDFYSWLMLLARLTGKSLL